MATRIAESSPTMKTVASLCSIYMLAVSRSWLANLCGLPA